MKLNIMAYFSQCFQNCFSMCVIIMHVHLKQQMKVFVLKFSEIFNSLNKSQEKCKIRMNNISVNVAEGRNVALFTSLLLPSLPWQNLNDDSLFFFMFSSFLDGDLSLYTCVFNRFYAEIRFQLKRFDSKKSVFILLFQICILFSMYTNTFVFQYTLAIFFFQNTVFYFSK